MLIFLNHRERVCVCYVVSGKNSIQKRKRNRSMFGQKSREREMYISEHVAHIRHRSDGVHIQAFALVSAFLFLFLLFFSTTREREREHIQNNTQRVNRRANSFVGSFVSLFLTFIVVYNRQNFRRSLSLFLLIIF